jgi:large subunit GTPase 1
MSARKGKSKSKDSGGFGSALINSKKKRALPRAGEGNHGPTKYDIPDSPVPLEDRLRSRTDDYTLGDFVTDSELSGKSFQAQRGPIRILDREQLTREAFESLHRTPEQLEAEDRLRQRLTIPRRPHWDETTTPDDLHEMETREILEWRRSLSIIEESDGVVVSPFEKNPEVWKELWRVLERSQIAIYILDARDPLSFFCEDFVRHMNELSIPVLLALNKADLVPPPIRTAWSQYFGSIQTDLTFSFEFVTTIQTDDTELLTPKQLVVKTKALAREPGRDGRVTIGFVGFPNVGKSSMLNSAVGRICVKSSSTPGKTKHLQTINMEEEGITLCDCPGLVFPSFQQSRAAMVCNGVLNIDQMTDWLAPSQIICEKVPTEAFNLLYGTKLTGLYSDANVFLQSLAGIRGFTTARGNPDEARVARIVLKDYVRGKMIHCELPPGVRLKEDEVEKPEPPPVEEPEEEPDLALPDAKPKKPVFTVNPKRRGVIRFSSFE